MVVYLVVGLVAFAVSALTLFSGFGLGTLLMPAFALFFPADVAVTATAFVHGANSVFKSWLLYRSAARRVIVRFGLPAIATAFLGAWVLSLLSGLDPLFGYRLGDRQVEVTPLELVLGLLILLFALVELLPVFHRLELDPKWLPLGGVVSGFFGGLSGHQGALRAAFLTRLGLSPTEFAATQAVLALLVDLSRITMYVIAFLRGTMRGFPGAAEWGPVIVASLCAFGGALLGRSLLTRMTVARLRWITGGLLLVVGTGLATGLL